MPQSQPGQQSRLNEIQMLQRHIMLKQFQELQKQQQFQDLGDVRQQNYINGTPIHDPSQRFMSGNMNSAHHGASPFVQGFSNGMGLVSPQLDASLYVASAGNNLGPHSHLLGEPHDSANVFVTGSYNQAEKPIMQASRHEFQEKNLFGQFLTEGSNSEVLPGNFQQVDPQSHVSAMELGGRQEQAGWCGHFPEKIKNNDHSPDSCSLDPLEQKILFNMDDNGSWSELMQSAVAEVSNGGDTGPQEEWNRLTFRNLELSNDNQPLNFSDSGKQQFYWVDINMPSTSDPSPKPELKVNNSNMSSSFPGFQQPGIHFSLKQKESDDHRQSIFSYTSGTQPGNTPHSNASQHTIMGQEFRENNWMRKSDSQHLGESNQNPSGQVLSQQIPQVPSGHDLGFNYNFSSSGMDLDKGHLPDVQRNLTEEVSPSNNGASDISALFERASGFHGPNMTAQPGKNMLELGMQFGSKDSTSFSEVPQAENPAAQSYNKPSPSQSFGLRLSPPSQQLAISNCFDSSPISPQMGKSSSFQSPQLPILEANPVTQPFVTSGTSQQAGLSTRLPNMWKEVPTQGNRSANEPQKFPISFLPSPDLEASPELHNGAYFNGGNEPGPHSMNSEGSSLRGEFGKKETRSPKVSSGTLDPVSQKGKGLLETNAFASGSSMNNSHQQGFGWAHNSENQSQKISDLEVFGRSLKPSHIVAPQNYSLLHQVQSVRNVENDPNKLHENNSGFQNVVNNQSAAKKISQPLDREANQKRVTPGQNDSLGVSHATEQPQISLRMAPSWFDHFGTLKNGQMLQMRDRGAAQQFSSGKLFENLGMNNSIVQVNPSGAGRETSILPTTGNSLVAVNNLPPPYVLPPEVPHSNLTILRPKKRKIAAFEHLSWHKEVIQGPKRLLDISLSDLEWAQAANRLIEKVDDESATTEDPPSLRQKNRLILTTQLMQHVFRPPPAVILSGDAASNCDSMAHFAARLALGDACCLSNSSDMSSEKLKTPQRIGDQETIKVVENFIKRSEKLEADFLTLDKSASILDRRVEAEELDKFCVITRLAKYHSSRQAAEASSSSFSGTRRAFVQKYVEAAPMPRTVPEGAYCLSL